MGGFSPANPPRYNPYAGSRLVDLIMERGRAQSEGLRRQGEIQAAAQQRSGEVWGNAISSIGQQLGQGIQQYGAKQQDKKVGAAVSAGMASPDNVDQILSGLAPELRQRAIKGISDANAAAALMDERKARAQQLTAAQVKATQEAQQATADYAGTLAMHTEPFLKAADGGLGALTFAHRLAKGHGVEGADQFEGPLQQLQAEMQQAQGNPQAMAAVADKVRQTFGPILERMRMGTSAGTIEKLMKEREAGAYILTEGGKRFGPDNQLLAENPKVEKPPNWELKETSAGLQPWNPKDPTTILPPIAKGKPAASTIINPEQASNVKEMVAGMMDGSLPPLLPGRATKEYSAVLAEAHRQHYDLAGAATDWNATQKHIASMNGAQQLRLNQAVNQLPELLDSVDALASKWKGGRFPVLNKANLYAAKAGVYGPEVGSVARQLDAQIADVTADLGNVYMGGNSPTDHALGLAAKSLSADWDEKVLHDMVRLAKSNVTIRQNSIRNTGVQGASQGNPYAAPQAPPPPPAEAGGAAAFTVTAPNGKVYTFPNAAQADAFKKRAGIP